jgi:hypothetical protein
MRARTPAPLGLVLVVALEPVVLVQLLGMPRGQRHRDRQATARRGETF